MWKQRAKRPSSSPRKPITYSINQLTLTLTCYPFKIILRFWLTCINLHFSGFTGILCYLYVGCTGQIQLWFIQPPSPILFLVLSNHLSTCKSDSKKMPSWLREDVPHLLLCLGTCVISFTIMTSNSILFPAWDSTNSLLLNNTLLCTYSMVSVSTLLSRSAQLHFIT